MMDDYIDLLDGLNGGCIDPDVHEDHQPNKRYELHDSYSSDIDYDDEADFEYWQDLGSGLPE